MTLRHLEPSPARAGRLCLQSSSPIHELNLETRDLTWTRALNDPDSDSDSDRNEDEVSTSITFAAPKMPGDNGPKSVRFAFNCSDSWLAQRSPAAPGSGTAAAPRQRRSGCGAQI